MSLRQRPSSAVPLGSFSILTEITMHRHTREIAETGLSPFPQTVSGINAEVPTFFLENPFPGPAEGSAVPLGCQAVLERVESHLQDSLRRTVDLFAANAS